MRLLQCILCEDNSGTALIPSAATVFFRGCTKATGSTRRILWRLRITDSSTEAKEQSQRRNRTPASSPRPAIAPRFPPAIKTDNAVTYIHCYFKYDEFA